MWPQIHENLARLVKKWEKNEKGSQLTSNVQLIQNHGIKETKLCIFHKEKQNWVNIFGAPWCIK